MSNLEYTFLHLNISRSENEPVNSLVNFEAMHLQWFAAEDEGRTFDPTETKLRKAREEGRVPKSQEIPSYLILLMITGILWGLGSYFSRLLFEVFSSYFSSIHSLNKVGFQAEGQKLILNVMKILWPILGLSFAMGILGNIIQFGWAPSAKPITPDFSKVQFKFSKWIEKIISVQGWYNTGTSIIKIGIVVVIIWINYYIYKDRIAGTVTKPFIEGIALSAQLSFSIIIECALVFLGMGLIDYAFQRNQFMEQLKMSIDELKEEFKEQEMNPEVKRRISTKMQQFMSQSMPETISNSDVLITNPTHYAVAMKYELESMNAPMVMAKGEDEVALRMRRLATEREVPIIENKKLARALYAELNVGDEIPQKYYEAVVLIFQEVYKMKREPVYE